MKSIIQSFALLMAMLMPTVACADVLKPQTETITVNGVSFTMVAVEGGTFMMGATAEQGDAALSDEYPPHQVTLSDYWIGQTEVTQALWQAVMGNNPSDTHINLDYPVINVSWYDCQEFIKKLNQMTGKYFRLPTEAEWEFAARGGNKSQGCKYAGSDSIDDVAWYLVNAYKVGKNSPDFGIHAVRTKAANELGLYDMSGNVLEWCQDRYDDCYSGEDQRNPTGPASGTDRVCRGGAWNMHERCCRVSFRFNHHPWESFSRNLGLRLALWFL